MTSLSGLAYHDGHPYNDDPLVKILSWLKDRADQSSIKTFLQVSGKSCWQTLAAIDTLSNIQKPIGLLHSAWCPGGRITAMAFLARPPATARQVSIAPPAESRAQENVSVLK